MADSMLLRVNLGVFRFARHYEGLRLIISCDLQEQKESYFYTLGTDLMGHLDHRCNSDDQLHIKERHMNQKKKEEIFQEMKALIITLGFVDPKPPIFHATMATSSVMYQKHRIQSAGRCFNSWCQVRRVSGEFLPALGGYLRPTEDDRRTIASI